MYYSHLLDRFLRYVQTYSESSSVAADSGVMPSTPQQNEFARLLADDMTASGLSHVQITPYCYVYGFLPASAGYEAAEPFCLLAHMDTSEAVSGKNVRPQIHEHYDGQPIKLNGTITLDPADDSDLADAGRSHDTVITSDGTTLLGADDKAGIAEIVSAIEYLSSHTELPHGKIEVIFSPDEETGHGMDKVPLDLIVSKRAYTVDGGHIGQLDNECFNAASAVVTFTGRSTHPGRARAAKMVNAVSIAALFIRSLPAAETPETTDGRDGYTAALEISGSVQTAVVQLILRDFSTDGLERRRHIVEELAQAAALSYGGTASLDYKLQYLNMGEALKNNPSVVDELAEAYEQAGITPVFTPVRGGTDGSVLTAKGIPTPNIFTGGHRYHSQFEWAALSQMEKSADVLIKLSSIIAQQHRK